MPIPCGGDGNRVVAVVAAMVGEDRVVADASWDSNGGSSPESLTASEEPEERANEFGLNVQLGLKMRLKLQSIQVLIRLLPSL